MQHTSRTFKSSKRSLKSGFTLFEMLITVAIMIIISGVVFYNHTKFESDTEITNLAYQIALSFRQAQVYSVSVRQFGTTQEAFRVPYGLHFDKEVTDQFILFADVNGNGSYDSQGSSDMECNKGAANSECVEKVTIGRDNQIKGWCGLVWSGGQDCVFPASMTGGGFQYGSEFQYFDVMFRRPNADAQFAVYATDDYGGQIVDNFCNSQSEECSGFALCLLSPEERQKRVVIYSTGQISVENVDLTATGDFCHPEP